MQTKIFNQIGRRKRKRVNLRTALSFLLLLLPGLISFSLTGCGGGGGGGSSSTSDGPINPAVFSGWEMTNGPFSGSTLALTVDPTDSGVVYSITRKKEVYKSIDGGLSWTYFPTINSETQENIRAQQLEIAPTDNQVFYLGTGSQGLYKSTDGGETWVHISNELPEDQYGYLSVDQILIDPSNPNTIYARLDMGYRIYKTVDGGQNWFKINDQTADLTPVQDLLIDPQNTQTLYIGLWHYVSSEPHPEKGGIWKSDDGGQTWLQKCGECPWCLPKDIYGNWVRVNELAMGPQESLRIYAGTDYCLLGSDDSGETWGMIEIVGIPVADHQKVTSLEVDPNDEKTVYVGVEDNDNWDHSGLWVTTDSGWNWTQIPKFEGKWVSFIRIAPSDSTVFVDADDDTYKRSRPTEPWQQVNFDMVADIRVNAFSNILPLDKDFIYAGTELGVYKTMDGGSIWESKSQGLDDQYIYTLVMDPNDNQRVYAGTLDGVYVTTDAGENWVDKNNGLTASGTFTLAMDPINRDILYVGTTDGIFKTFDGGESWIEKGVFPYLDNSVWRLAVAPDDHLVLYASVEDWFGTEAKIYKSINGGESWQDVSGNLPTDIAVWGIAISPTSNNVVYIGINGYGIYKTVDGGGNWDQKNNGLTSTNVISLTISQGDNKIVYAGTEDDGVFAMADGGDNWIQIDAGLMSALNRSVNAIAIAPDDDLGYAGTGCGVFKAY